MKDVILRLLRVMLLWVTVDPSSLVVRSIAPSNTALQSCDLHGYSVQREELLACGSSMHMCHLSVTLSVEFADGGTIQKAHYRAGTNHRSDYRCITFCNASFVMCFNCLWNNRKWCLLSFVSPTSSCTVLILWCFLLNVTACATA